MSKHTQENAPARVTLEAGTLYTVDEIASLIRVDATTVRRWIKTGALEAVSLPHARKRQAYRIKGETVLSLLTPSVLTPAREVNNDVV